MTPIRNCAKAIIVREGKILAVKYSDEGGEYFALPGGGQRHGETLPEALVRECHEELGVSIVNRGLRFIREYVGKEGESSWRDAEVHQVEFIYECELDQGQEPQGGYHKDLAQVEIVWLPIDSLSEYLFYPRELIAYLSRPLPVGIEYWGKVD